MIYLLEEPSREKYPKCIVLLKSGEQIPLDADYSRMMGRDVVFFREEYDLSANYCNPRDERYELRYQDADRVVAWVPYYEIEKIFEPYKDLTFAWIHRGVKYEENPDAF